MKSKKTFKNGGNTPRNNRNRHERSVHGSDLSTPLPASRGQGDRQKDQRVRSPKPAKISRPRFKMAIYGAHAVEAALLNSDRVIHAIYATEQSVDDMIRLAEQAVRSGRQLPDITLLEKDDFDHVLSKNSVHQGLALDCDPLPEFYLPDLINRAAAQERSVIVLLDQVTDPHNLGAVIRSACAFGAAGIVVQSRHAPELTGTTGALVAKIASGAVEHLPVVYETNLARAIESMQESGYFAVALDERGEQAIGDAPKYPKTLLVLGAEGPGLRPLVRDKCDVLVKLPTAGALSSLNVSNAAAVALYAVRQ